MKHFLGISAGFHDAAASVIREDGEILFAAHSERYSGIKNDPTLHRDLLRDLDAWQYDHIAWYERPWAHNLQQLISGQHAWQPWTTGGAVRQHMGTWPGQYSASLSSWSHHLSHAAAGFQTSPFDEATVVVIDAIGELDTISIFSARYDDLGRAQYKRLWRQRYPHSIGLFYSAVTQAVGLKPMEEEYITMGMAAYGTDVGAGWLRDQVMSNVETLEFRENLHTGLPFSSSVFDRKEDLAAAAQRVTENLIWNVMYRARELNPSSNLVYMGGVALNCLANRQLGRIFDRVWIMPNPGDAGSSLGAAALAHGGRLKWRDAYLGHDIPGEYPVRGLMAELENHGMVGVASGRAEFGPRALGNRSLLADPRGTDVKDRVNEIKRRQKFRPFAPVILEELVDDYFVMPRNWRDSRYMQVIADCRRPDLYPAVCHVDNTSRVQTVARDGSGIRRLLEAWYAKTGCPMLLNTSLNIRGEPMVNDRSDAGRFAALYSVRVLN